MMIGAVLTILVFIWTLSPSSGGIITVTFLLLLSFILFVNSVSTNSKAHFDAALKDVPGKRIKSWIVFAEYSFGLGFTFVIVAFSILTYKYLLDYTNRSIVALFLPIVFLLTAWILVLIYNCINYSDKTLKALRNVKRDFWIFLELIGLIVIIMDYLQVITIP